MEWICDALPIEMLRDRQMGFLQVNYDLETLPTQAVDVYLNPVPENPALWSLEGVNQSDGRRSVMSVVGGKSKLPRYFSKGNTETISNEGFPQTDDSHLCATALGAQPGDDGLGRADQKVRDGADDKRNDDGSVAVGEKEGDDDKSVS